MPLKVACALIAEFIVFAAILFAAAGTWRWPEAWLFLALFFGASGLLTHWLSRHDPALLAERMKWPYQKTQPLWDRLIMILVMPLFVAWLAVMGLDSVRLGLTHFPLWLKGIGALGMLLSFAVLYRVFRENTFLAPAVKLQTDRGHHVIATGPYGWIRHPMYAFATLLMFSSALLLGSLFGVCATIVFLVPLIARTVLEDRTLQRDLPGYADYARRVRYRLVPGVW